MAGKLAEIIAALHDESAHKDALARLKKIGCATLGLDDAAELVLAAPGPFPPPENAWSADTSSKLLYLARNVVGHVQPDARADAVAAAVERVFSSLSEQARSASLQVLTALGTPAAARVYARLLVAHAKELAAPRGPRPVLVPHFTTAGAAGKPSRATKAVAAELFPSLFPAAGEAGLAGTVYGVLLAFLEAGLVSAEAFREQEPSFVALLRREIAGARAHQQVSEPGRINWKHNAPYAAHRHLAGIALDVAGWWESPSILEAVEGCADLTDPHLRLLRAMSLMRLGTWVPGDELAWIAAHPRERWWLRRGMEELGRPHAELPPACTDQRQLAAGAMVEWLCFGTELGREPDEIELVHMQTHAPARSRGRSLPLDYYFFRFRVTEDHWAQKDGWMLGMAGGYPRVTGGTTESDGRTFSRFAKWEEKPLREHVADYLE
ncbi:MAG: hypothetical protein KIT58_05955 [Planctomycetota bacterium]|nr:hypothetical protein [Planctomycetota bacterium]